MNEENWDMLWIDAEAYWGFNSFGEPKEDGDFE